MAYISVLKIALPFIFLAITLLGQKTPLTWSVAEQGLVLQLPRDNVADFAYVLRITPKRTLVTNQMFFKNSPTYEKFQIQYEPT